MPSYTIRTENTSEPDHIATFPETKINLLGSEQAQFQLLQKGNKRKLKCIFQDPDEDEENMEEVNQIAYIGSAEKYDPSSTNQSSTHCILYIDKKTGEAIVRPAIVHKLVSEKEDILKNWEEQIMAEQNLNSTLEEDSRTNLERRTDYTTNFGSKMQQRMLATDNTLRKDSKNNYVSELVLSRMSKNEKSENFQKFTTSEGESGTCPPRNINAKKVEQVYTFKELVSEEIMDGLSYHVEKCKEDDISYVSGYYGEIITNLNLTAFTADFILKGSHMTETERNYCYALCTLLVRLYKTFPMVNNRCKKFLTEQKLNEFYFDNFQISSKVKQFLISEFLAKNNDDHTYILPSNTVDKIQAWILVLSLLLLNFKCDMKPFTDFFKISSKVFEKVVRVVGAYSDGKDEKYIRLKLPLAGIDTGNRKRR